MHSYLHLNSFKIYNILLIIVFSILVNSSNSLQIINTSFYSIFHYLIIYLGIYYYQKSLYLIFFLYGLFIDIYLLNEIGPHLITFLFFLLFLNLTKKYLQNLNSFEVYILILISQFIFIICENVLSHLLFSYNLEMIFFLEIIIISLILSFPIFLIFSKIDQIN